MKSSTEELCKHFIKFNLLPLSGHNHDYHVYCKLTNGMLEYTRMYTCIYCYVATALFTRPFNLNLMRINPIHTIVGLYIGKNMRKD